VEYLNHPLNADELAALCEKLGIDAPQLVRRGEAEFAELGLAGASPEQLLQAMASHPKLMQRPIVVNGDRAAIGRPPESVLEIL